jgi:peptide-methionine (R)-S-oxide reductase
MNPRLNWITLLGKLMSFPGSPLKLTNLTASTASSESGTPASKVEKTEAEWKQTLTPEQYAIMRRSGTEPAFTGEYWNNHRDGVYRCAACGEHLFDSKTKFDSGSGWPSFWEAVGSDKVHLNSDTSHGMTRIEAVCANCKSHLGHVFEDGPQPSGQRYCINSACLSFEER